MSLAPFIAWLGVLGFAAASFFFALAETALFSLGKWRARQLAERSPGLGGSVAALLNEPQDLLATIVLGNTLANSALVAIALWMSLDVKGAHLGLTLVGAFLLILLGCEVVPKTLAVRMPEAWALRVAQPMIFLVRVSRPLRQVAQRANEALLRLLIPKSIQPQTTLTDADYKELIELAFQQGTLAASEKEIILQIIQLDHRTAKDVMRPRARMACLPDDLPVEEMIAAARRFGHERLPLYDESPDTIVGILNCRTLLLDPNCGLEDVIEFPSFVPESMNLLQLLGALQRQKRGLAIVLDEFGSAAGLVTMEDIIEAIVGQIRSEGEAPGFVMEQVALDRWRVNGTMRVEDFRREYPALGELPGVDTMGGLLVALKEVVPQTGESAVFGGVKLTALAADERRVREVMVERITGKGRGGVS
ncbi:MAG: HlyC/CorC family transporter [Proteobacteria bacterium]|nr:HlyC/CorC family transporter [Pseudomonadota bacterium]